MPKGVSPKPKGKDSAHYKHGYSIRNSQNTREPIYLCWVNMRQRCNNSSRFDYKFYGGRGISVCERWDEYKNFLEDMGESYYKHKKENPNTSLDRIDVNGNYCKENCKWATRFEQSNNRNYNRLIEYRGESKTCGIWVKELPFRIKRQELFKRIFTRGWSVERAMTQPCGGKFIKKTGKFYPKK